MSDLLKPFQSEPEPPSQEGLTIEARARKYLAQMPPAVSGNGGHTATLKAAMVLVRGFALPQPQALTILTQEYNPRCRPSWSDRELRHKIEDATRLADPPMGYLLDAKRKSSSGSASLARPFSEEEFQAMQFLPVEPKQIAGLTINPSLLRVDDFESKVVDESVLEQFQPIPEDGYRYLREERGLTDRSIKDWELGCRGNRITIPIREMNTNALVGVSGRAFGPSEKKYLHESGFRGSFYLYGEHRVKGYSDYLTGVLVEGQFDVMALWQRGYYAVAMFGSHLSAFQAHKLKELFGRLIILPDGDKAGYEAAAKAERIAGKLLPTRIASMPEGKDPDQLSDLQLEEFLGQKHFAPH